MGRVNIWFEINTQELCDISKSHGRHTVMEDDVIEFFSVSKNKFLDG